MGNSSSSSNSTNGSSSSNSVNQSVDNMSWTAYQPAGRKVICPAALLSLFHESAHAVAIVKHSMDVVRKALQHLNAGQTPVVTNYLTNLCRPLPSRSSGSTQRCMEKTSLL